MRSQRKWRRERPICGEGEFSAGAYKWLPGGHRLHASGTEAAAVSIVAGWTRPLERLPLWGSCCQL